MSTKIWKSKAPSFKPLVKDKENKSNQEANFQTYFEFTDEDISALDNIFDADSALRCSSNAKRKSAVTVPREYKTSAKMEAKKLKPSNDVDTIEEPIRVNKTANCNVVVKIPVTDKEKKGDDFGWIVEQKENVVEPQNINDLLSMLPPPKFNSIAVSTGEPSKLLSEYASADSDASKTDGSESSSSSRSQSPEPFTENKSTIPSKEAPKAVLYECPECEADEMNATELCDHVVNEHSITTENLICPICEVTYGDSHAARVKNFRSHVETHRAASVTIGNPLRAAPRPELITRSATPSSNVFRGARLNGRKVDISELLWEFVLSLDIDPASSQLTCSGCFEGFKSTDTHAILNCSHNFHAECLLTESCPLCAKEQELEENETLKSKKKKSKPRVKTGL